MDSITTFFTTSTPFMVLIGQEPEAVQTLLRWESQESLQDYQRISKLPQFRDKEEISQYEVRWQSLEQQPEQTAVRQVLRLFQKNHPGASDTICKNFVLKLLRWQEEFVTERPSRLVLVTEEKTTLQSFLGLYFLSLCQVQVLFLSPCHTLDLPEKLRQLASCHSQPLGAYGPLPAFVRAASPTPPPSAPVPAKSAPIPPLSVPSAQIPPMSVPSAPVPAKSAPIPPISPPSAPASPQENLPSKAQELSLVELAEKASSVVMLTVYDQEGQPRGYGSGIMISRKGYILTNFHVVARGCQFGIQVEHQEESHMADHITKVHPEADLALLRVDCPCQPLEIFQGQLVRGQGVVAIGSPLGMFNTVSDGIISGFRRVDDCNMIQFTAPTSRGSSGGAVLNFRGELVGMSTAGIDEGQNLNLAVDHHTILNFCQGFL